MAWVLKMDEVIESGLVHDFDASLSGIGQELGAGAYSMRDCKRKKISSEEECWESYLGSMPLSFLRKNGT